MGILDFFSKKRNNIKNDKMQKSENNKVKYPEMELNYSDGTKANIKFKDVIDYTLENGKSSHLQEIEIFYYNQEEQFERKVCYIDPIAMVDENNNYVYNSEAYYQNLKKNNLGLAKAFFKKSEINNLPSNYIGNLSIYNDGRKPTRSFNQKNGFYADYIKQYQRKEQERINMQKDQQKKFQEEMLAQTMASCEVHYKDSHAEVLTPQMRDERFGNWQR